MKGETFDDGSETRNEVEVGLMTRSDDEVAKEEKEGSNTNDDMSTSTRGQHPDANAFGRQDGYLPIENYAVIGNMRNAALCGSDGSIDFWCYPKFDSPSVFARILDWRRGGHFAIQPVARDTRWKQQYLPNSNVLQTKFLANEGAVHVTDFMPLPRTSNESTLPWLLRTVSCMRGKLRLRVEVFPAFDYARTSHSIDVVPLHQHHQQHQHHNSSNQCNSSGKQPTAEEAARGSTCDNTCGLNHQETSGKGCNNMRLDPTGLGCTAVVFTTEKPIEDSCGQPLVMDLRYVVSGINDEEFLEINEMSTMFFDDKLADRHLSQQSEGNLKRAASHKHSSHPDHKKHFHDPHTHNPHDHGSRRVSDEIDQRIQHPSYISQLSNNDSIDNPKVGDKAHDTAETAAATAAAAAAMHHHHHQTNATDPTESFDDLDQSTKQSQGISRNHDDFSVISTLGKSSSPTTTAFDSSHNIEGLNRLLNSELSSRDKDTDDKRYDDEVKASNDDDQHETNHLSPDVAKFAENSHSADESDFEFDNPTIVTQRWRRRASVKGLNKSTDVSPSSLKNEFTSMKRAGTGSTECTHDVFGGGGLSQATESLSSLLENFQWTVEQRDLMAGPGVFAEFDIFEGQRITFVVRERPQPSMTTNTNNMHTTNNSTTGSSKSHNKTHEHHEGGVPGILNLPDPPLSEALIDKLIMDTMYFWAGWIGKSTYTGRWRETVNRSALTLKLMTYKPTGAVIAAPTFGLPEEIGGTRNWDYRYTWIRDSSFTVYALLRIGMTEEARDFVKFIKDCFSKVDSNGELQVMYSITGKQDLPEVVLDHLEGYRRSPQVRIGNAASKHLQLDIYGELLDSMYLFSKYGTPLSYDEWLTVRKMVNYVCRNWTKPDMSIWEVRGKREQFVYSKIMCWVAIDRGLRFVEKRSLPCPERDVWLKTRDEIYFTIMERGYSKEHGAFLQTLDGHDRPILDASTLIMPLVFFISPGDPRMISTLKKMMRPPSKGGLLANNLLYRYDRAAYNDGVEGLNEGSFSMCTFWLAEALARSGQYHPGLLRRSVLMFEQMISYGNHVQLFSEEVAPTGEMLGNFPQAFTHIALVSAAFNLDRDLKQRRA